MMKNNLLTNQVTDLKDTIPMMISDDYKERFKAEYNQVLIRYQNLKTMLHNWDSGSLNFEPTCPRSLYDLQIKSMQEYLTVLEARACIEEITNIETEPEPESIPDAYYVRLITETDRDQLERFDKKHITHCAYTLLFPEKTSGYGLFKRKKNLSIQDELIGYCILDKDVYIAGVDDFNTNVENIQKQFSTYDFSKAVLANFEQLPENKNLHQFFLKQIIQQYNQIIFLMETTPDEEYMLKSFGFQYVENEWVYFPKKEIVEIPEKKASPNTLHNNYYVRLITEADKEQVQEMDEGVLGLDCVFEIPNQYIGYGLFEKSQNSSVPDELIGFSTIDKCINTRVDIDNFKEHVKLIQKQFPTYDFSKAAIVEIEPYPTDKKVCQFFLQQVLEKYNQPVFIESTVYCNKDFLKEIGCISIEHEWLYLPKEIMKHRVYFTCENCSYFNANSKTCQNKLGPQYNYKCRPDKTCRYHHQYDIDIE